MGDSIRKSETAIDKKYLIKEFDLHNHIVTVYLEFADLQALNRIDMQIRD